MEKCLFFVHHHGLQMGRPLRVGPDPVQAGPVGQAFERTALAEEEMRDVQKSICQLYQYFFLMETTAFHFRQPTVQFDEGIVAVVLHPAGLLVVGVGDDDPLDHPTNVASVNLVVGCSKVFVFTIL